MFKRKINSNDFNFTKIINKEMKVRKEKLITLKKQSYNKLFPNDFRCSDTLEQLNLKFGNKENSELKNMNIQVSVAGRMVTRRIMGKASFINLQDINGSIQLYFSSDDVSEDIYNNQFKKWDIGDILGARGILFKTKTGRLSVRCNSLTLLTKSLRPLPDKFHGLQDQEICYRQRYLDLIANDKSRNIFKKRSEIINSIRKFMNNHKFMEVETPMMQTIPGGAPAKPFNTHHNALNMDMFLRISPELYLKRLIIGGFNRIFEINRNFRNEGISICHNPEFTMMELYMAYADYKDLIKLTELLFYNVAQDIMVNTKIHFGKEVFDFSKPFEKLTMREAIKRYYPIININDLDNLDYIKNFAENIGITIRNNWDVGHIMSAIFEKKIESNLIQPTFITEYPIEVSPLARRNDLNPKITDRFEFFIGGYEIGNGFSEINDSEDQTNRFKSQIAVNDCECDESMIYDEDYITALEYGLPPTAGLGIGIDRMVMIFTNSQNIRDVILFPSMRPLK